VPEHQQLDILRCLAATSSHYQSEQDSEGRIQGTEEHPRIMLERQSEARAEV
jgi:hypothetical protein